jgi:two-component system, NarL family, sensor kinase
MPSNNYQIVSFLLITTFVIVLLMTSIVVILYLYQKKRILFQEIISQTQLEIQEETFQNISREIHDNIGLSLTLAKLHLNTLTLNCPRKINPLIEYSIELISQAIVDLSDISKSLNSDIILNYGLLNLIEIKLDKLAKSEKFRVEFEVGGQVIFIHSQKELILYRIFQEALNNIIKHSKADSIAVYLVFYPESVQLTVKDNGIGINDDQLEYAKSSKIMTGLGNIKKRTKMLNGECNIVSNKTGTSITVTVPIEKDEK